MGSIFYCTVRKHCCIVLTIKLTHTRVRLLRTSSRVSGPSSCYNTNLNQTPSILGEKAMMLSYLSSTVQNQRHVAHLLVVC